MRISRWQALVATLVMAASFLTLWIGMNHETTLTHYTVHPPGEAVTVDGVTYRYRGMFHSQVIQGTNSPSQAAPGMTWVAVVVEVTMVDLEGYCAFGVTDIDQEMTWSSDQATLLDIDTQSNCFDITETDTPTDVIAVFEVPSSQTDRIGGVVIHPASWRDIAEVIR